VAADPAGGRVDGGMRLPRNDPIGGDGLYGSRREACAARTRLAERVDCGMWTPRNDPLRGSQTGWLVAGGRQNAVAAQRPYARETARRSAAGRLGGWRGGFAERRLRATTLYAAANPAGPGQVDGKMPLPSNDPTRGRRPGGARLDAGAAGGEGGGVDGLGNAVSEQRPYMRQQTQLAWGQVDGKMPLPSNDPLHGTRARRSAAGRLRDWWGRCGVDGLGNAVSEQRPYMRQQALLTPGQVDDKTP